MLPGFLSLNIAEVPVEKFKRKTITGTGAGMGEKDFEAVMGGE